MNRIRLGVSDQALSMLQRLETLWPNSRTRLQADALAELDGWEQVQVVRVADTASQISCSVAGGYVHSTVPPTLTVTESISDRRQQFTALHELGHHLQKNDADLALAVRRQRADREAFEDAACDLFASLVLIPDCDLPARSNGRSPSAADVVDLYQSTQASRAACCVRVTGQLDTHGVVALYDAVGTVSFAAAHGEVFPPARGSSQVNTPLVAAALRTGRNVRVDDTFVQYSTGGHSQLLYGDAVWAGSYLFTVSVLDRPGWRSFASPRPDTSKFRPREWICEVCEVEFLPTATCRRCETPRCPTGHCTCTLAAERQCQRCFLLLAPSRFASQTSVYCRDCEE